MKSIKVFIYSYKNKNLLNQVKDIISKESGMFDVSYYVFDQNNVDRDFHFKDIPNVTYRFVHWDDYKSIAYYRNAVILNDKITNYFLELNPNISIMNSWDLYLKSVLKDRSVISGKGIPKLSIDRHLVVVDRDESSEVSLVNYIDINLLFLKLTDAMILTKLNMLKDLGQDLLASVLLVSAGYRIESLPSTAYEQHKQENDGTYVPYSKIHGYNKMLDYIKSKNNQLFDSFHGISLRELTRLPYEIDDVSYLKFKISLEYSEIPRFLSGYNGVQII